MESKTLLAGLIGFFLGGLLVSVAATTFDKPETAAATTSMSAMTEALQNKNGDEFDKLFISHMIEHHQGAVAMAKLAAKNAKHQEVKQLSTEIIKAQTTEIDTMRHWQKNWGYAPNDDRQDHPSH